MRIVLDSGIISALVHSKPSVRKPLAERLKLFQLASPQNVTFLPEIIDYEVRRKLLHLLIHQQTTPKSIERLDRLPDVMVFVPVDRETFQEAARLWADVRSRGKPTAPPAALDVDVILAAQARQVGGTVVTTNRKHLDRYVPTIDWTEIPTTA